VRYLIAWDHGPVPPRARPSVGQDRLQPMPDGTVVLELLR
jgi:hypothetical protein